MPLSHKENQKEKAVVLVSGGMDSCTVAAIAAQNYELAFIHFNYGQRTEYREWQAFDDIAYFFGVEERLVVDAGFFAQIGASSLTDRKIEVESANLGRNAIPSSYVPFRNANMLAAAVSWAEAIGASAIFIGAVEDDSSGYPDCRKEFIQAFNDLIRLGTRPETNIRVYAPIRHLKKHEIIQTAVVFDAPLHLTWSCYQNQEKACGVCDSCALRLRGFQRAGYEDPIDYVVRPFYAEVDGD